MKFLAAVLLATVLGVSAASSLGSCATLASSLPTVIAYAQDGFVIVDQIVHFVDAFFVAHPDAVLQKKVDVAAAKAKSALNLAIRLASGAGDLDQAKVDEAFAEFRSAYIELIALVGPMGVTSGGNRAAATPGGGLKVPEPLALVHK